MPLSPLPSCTVWRCPGRRCPLAPSCGWGKARRRPGTPQREIGPRCGRRKCSMWRRCRCLGGEFREKTGRRTVGFWSCRRFWRMNIDENSDFNLQISKFLLWETRWNKPPHKLQGDCCCCVAQAAWSHGVKICGGQFSINQPLDGYPFTSRLFHNRKTW